MFSKSALSLNRIDISDIVSIPNKRYDVISNIFMLVGIKYVSGNKYYMIAPIYYHYSSVSSNLISNFSSLNRDKILISKKALDVTPNEFESLCNKGYVYKDKSIKEENYPKVIDGEYNENELIILAKYTPKYGDMFFCANGAGDLFLFFEYELWKTKKKLILKNASFVSNSYIRRSPMVYLFNTNYISSESLFSLCHLRYDSCVFLGLENNYKELKESNDLFDYLFTKFEKDSMLSYFNHIGHSLYSSYNSYSDTYELINIDRLHISVQNLVNLVPFLKGFVFNLDKISNYYLDIDGGVVEFNGYGEVLAKEDDLYINIDKPYYFSKDTILLDGDELKFRTVLPSYLSTDTVYYTLCIDFNSMSISHKDIRRYPINDSHAIISGYQSYDSYLLNYKSLTNDSFVDIFEDVDFTRLSKVNNINKNTELSVESLSNELMSLGYKKKTRQTTPYYVFMSMFKSTWLNEREFVTLRDYVSGNRKMIQLDLYKDGMYYSTLAGDFKEDTISTIFQEKTSKTNSKSVYNVPKIWLDVYNKNRNLVYYPSYLFFMNYSSVYNTSVGKLNPLMLSGNFYTCARFNPTGEFCICYCFSKHHLFEDYDIGIEDIKGDIEEFKQKNTYYSHISIANCIILMRFKTEEEMFKVYTELFRKRDCNCNLPIRLPLLKEKLALSHLTSINDIDVDDYEKELAYSNDSEYRILEKSILKNLGILDISWRDIYSSLSDELFNTMIFD